MIDGVIIPCDRWMGSAFYLWHAIWRGWFACAV